MNIYLNRNIGNLLKEYCIQKDSSLRDIDSYQCWTTDFMCLAGRSKGRIVLILIQ